MKLVENTWFIIYLIIILSAGAAQAHRSICTIRPCRPVLALVPGTLEVHGTHLINLLKTLRFLNGNSCTCMRLELIVTSLVLDSQGAGLDHQSHDLIQHIGRRHRGQLSVRVVRRRNLNQVSSNELDALKTPDDGPQLSGAPASSFRCTSSRCVCWVESVDVDTEVDWVLVANTFVDSLDDALRADGVNLTGFDDLEADVAVVVVVGETGEGGTDTGVDGGVVA